MQSVGAAPRLHTGHLRGVGALVLVALSWGVAFCLVKSAVAVLPPASVVTWRFGIAVVVLVLLRPSCLLGISGRTVLHGVFLGGLLGVGFLLHTWGMRTTSVLISAFVTGTVVVFAPIVARVWLGHRLGVRALCSVTLAVAGLALISVRGLPPGPGGLLILAAAVVWAVHLVGLALWADPGEVYTLTVVQLTTVTVVAWAAQVGTGAGLEVPSAASTWVSLLGLGALATGGSFVLLTWAQARVDATTAAVVLTLEPVFGAAAAVLLAGESLTVLVTVGAATVLAAALLSLQPPSRITPAYLPLITTTTKETCA